MKIRASSDRISRIVSVSHPYYKQRQMDDGTRSVFVGNLGWDVTWQSLKDHMRSAGRVIHADIMLDRSGRSKGCGLVEFQTSREADLAIQTLNESTLNGRTIYLRKDEGGGAAGRAAERMNRTDGKTDGGGGLGRSLDQPRVAPSKKDRNINATLVVENLNPSVAWQDLKDHMKSVGMVVRADVMLDADGKSVGQGVVEYQDAETAMQAIAELQDTQLQGSTIFLRPATETDEVDKARGVGRGRRLYVGQLAYSVAWQDLKDHFSNMGEVLRADVALEADSKRSKGFGFVEFASADDAHRAISELNNSYLHGRRIYVREDREER